VLVIGNQFLFFIRHLPCYSYNQVKSCKSLIGPYF
jgi:hypothetical protein